MSPTAGCTVRIAPEHLFSAHESGPVDEFTVVTVNVQHAAPPRAGALAAWLSGPGGADVAVLTEVGHGSGRSALQSALAAHGYHTVSPPDCPDYSVVLAARGTESNLSPPPWSSWLTGPWRHGWTSVVRRSPW